MTVIPSDSEESTLPLLQKFMRSLSFARNDAKKSPDKIPGLLYKQLVLNYACSSADVVSASASDVLSAFFLEPARRVFLTGSAADAAEMPLP